MSLALLLSTLLLAGGGGDWFFGWFKKIDPLCRSGKPEDARKVLPLLEQLEKEAKRQNNDEEAIAYARWKRGLCEADLEQYPRAIKTLEAAVEASKDSLRKSWVLFEMRCLLGEMSQKYGESDRAEIHLREATNMLRDAGGKALPFRKYPMTQGAEERRVRLGLLNSSYFLYAGKNDKAREALRAVEKDLVARKNSSEKWKNMYVEFKGHSAELDRRDSRTVQSLEGLRWCLTEVQSRRPQTRKSLQIQFNVLLSLAELYLKMARVEDARRQLDLAEDLLPQLTTKYSTALLLSARVTLQLEQIAFTFQPEDGQALLDRLAAVARLARNALAAPNVSTLFTALKKYEIAQIHELRGRVHEFQRDAKTAREEYDQGVRRCDEAVRLLKSIHRRSDHDLMLYVRRCRARLLLRQGADALPAAKKEAVEVFNLYVKNHGKSHVDRGDFYQLLLEVEAADGNFKAAAGHAADLRELSALHLAPYLATLTAAEQIKFFRMWDDPGLHASLRLGVRDKTLADSSAEWLLNGKAKIAEVMAHVNQHERGGDAYREFQRVIQHQAYLLHGRLNADARTLDKEILDVEAKKRELVEKRAGKLPGRWYTLADLRKGLSPGDVYVDVFSLRPKENAPRAYYAWVVSARDASVVELGEAGKIHELVTAFLKHQTDFDVLRRKFGRKKAETLLKEQVLKELSERVLAPVRKVAGRSKRWTVSPDGPLWNIPWGALLLPESGKYAVEEITFRYAISGRDLVERPADKVQIGDPWILADPDFDLALGKAWRPRGRKDDLMVSNLDGAREEGEQVAKQLKEFFKVKPELQDRQTTKQGLLDLKAPPRIVYLATHGFSPLPTRELAVDDPLLTCGLAFAGFNRLPRSKAKGEGSLPGLLTGAEVLMAPLRGTELVVLSACQSGRGKTQYGQSPADLRHAFHLAGARAVVSSLWSVPDEETKELMIDFVKDYCRTRASDKAEALNEAQRRMIERLRKSDFKHGHPFFWAAFTLSGS